MSRHDLKFKILANKFFKKKHSLAVNGIIDPHLFVVIYICRAVTFLFSFLTVIFSLTNISLSVAGSVQEYPISENIDKVEDHVLTLLLLYHSC